MVRERPEFKPQVTDAIYDDGVLRPVGKLSLKQNERVRLIVQTLSTQPEQERAAAVARMVAGFDKLRLRTGGPLPTRDELHERR